jgi:hypothetical protein
MTDRYHKAETINAKGLFSFTNDKILHTQIGDGIYLRIERIGPAVARVFFINEGYVEVEVPNGFTIIDHSNGDIDVAKLHGRNEYFIGWTDNYSMKLNDIVIVNLINLRQWAVQGPAQREIFSLES